MNMVKLMQICENKKRILNGIEKIEKIIVNSYGPQGRTWLLGSIDNYQINDDGYKIIKELKFDDIYENIALKLVLDMVSKTEEEAHDSTTLVVLLACSFIKQIFAIKEEIIPSIFIKEWQKVLDESLTYLNEYCCNDIDVDILKSIAKICVKEDSLGDIIGETIFNISEEGSLRIQESFNENSYIKYQKGYTIDTNDKYEKKIFNEVYVLLIQERLDSFVPLLKLIKEVKKLKTPLLIVAYDYYDDVYNSLKSLLSVDIPIIICKLEGYKNKQEKTLNDLKSISCSQIYNQKELINISINNLKKVDKVELDNNKIIMYNNSFDINEINKENRAQLLGNCATIYVGGTTKSMIKERISRIEDAKYSCFNTLKYGYVLGGGKTLFNVSNKIANNNQVSTIFQKTLKAPFLTLLNNSGYKFETLNLKEDEGIDLIEHKVISYKENKIFDCIYGIKRALINSSGLVYTFVHLYDAKINET